MPLVPIELVPQSGVASLLRTKRGRQPKLSAEQLPGTRKFGRHLLVQVRFVDQFRLHRKTHDVDKYLVCDVHKRPLVFRRQEVTVDLSRFTPLTASLHSFCTTPNGNTLTRLSPLYT